MKPRTVWEIEETIGTFAILGVIASAFCESKLSCIACLLVLVLITVRRVRRNDPLGGPK